jgi:hypothetical protein
MNWKEYGRTYSWIYGLRVFSAHLPEETEENHEKPQSG